MSVNNNQMFLFFCFGLGVDFAFEMFFLCFSIPVISSISFCFSCRCLYSLNSFYVFFLSFFDKLFNSTELVLLYYMLGLFFEYQFYFF